MRILPDMNFRENYKKRYDANYEKLTAKHNAWLEAKQQAQQARKPTSPEINKYRAAGFVAAIVLLGVFFFIGITFSSKFNEKKAYISQLQNGIIAADDLIKSYQVVNGEEMHEQVSDAVVYITDLQNQYVLNSFAEDFDNLSNRYLGDYNSNWASCVENLSNPVWKGYINTAQSFDGNANFILILYDSHIPVFAADIDFSLDGNGNLGVMTSVRKMMLS